MHTMLSFNDNGISDHFLSEDELKKVCPNAFKVEPTNPNVSQKYIMATTMDVVHDMAKLGWYPVEAKQCKNKKNSSGIRSFHMISFQNPDVKVYKDDEIEAYPRIICQNSHDGFNSFKFFCGFYKILCSNGLVVADEEFANISIRHINYTFDELKNTILSTIEKLPTYIGTINEMKKTVLNNNEKHKLAQDFFNIKKNLPMENIVDDETISFILNPNRTEDDYDDLWSVFNTCQENIFKGNFYIKDKNNKLRKQRPIVSIKKDLQINSAFWEIACNYIKINT